jgi:hypothetical protein
VPNFLGIRSSKFISRSLTEEKRLFMSLSSVFIISGVFCSQFLFEAYTLILVYGNTAKD